MGQHRQCRFRGPVQVLKDQHRRALLGHCPQHAQDCVEENRPGVTVSGRDVDSRWPGAQGGGGQAEKRGRSLGRDVAQGFRRRLLQRLLEDGDEGPVGGVEFLAARAPQHSGAVLTKRCGYLDHQPGLADTGLATHEDDLASVVLDGGPDCLETFHLRSAPDEGGPIPRKPAW